MYILIIDTFYRMPLPMNAFSSPDAIALAEAFASGRTDPVQVLEQALEQASRAEHV